MYAHEGVKIKYSANNGPLISAAILLNQSNIYRTNFTKHDKSTCLTIIDFF